MQELARNFLEWLFRPVERNKLAVETRQIPWPEELLPLYPVGGLFESARAPRELPLPIIRYFVVIGSLLLALLFASDRYLSLPPDAVHSAEVDRTTIRIHSARLVPEKIVFDTSQPVTMPSAVSLANARPDNGPREAHAMMVAPPRQVEKAAGPSVKQVVERPRTQARRVARERWKDRRLALEQGNLFAGW